MWVVQTEQRWTFHWQAKIVTVPMMHITAMALAYSRKSQQTPEAFSCLGEFSSDSHVTSCTVVPTKWNHSAFFCALNFIFHLPSFTSNALQEADLDMFRDHPSVRACVCMREY